jgi:hypothetical protein
MNHFKNSIAKWKRDAEVFHKENSAMLEGHFHTVEANIVCIALLFSLATSHAIFWHRQKVVMIKAWQQH